MEKVEQCYEFERVDAYLRPEYLPHFEVTRRICKYAGSVDFDLNQSSDLLGYNLKELIFVKSLSIWSTSMPTNDVQQFSKNTPSSSLAQNRRNIFNTRISSSISLAPTPTPTTTNSRFDIVIILSNSVTPQTRGTQLAPNAKTQARADPADPFATSAWQPHAIKKSNKYISA
ncbi:hypothetical protein KY284_018711 [Solanum tuberosum]|nr:hypothetical protein KY284_018711 [Solanum tuberosum]